MKSEKEIKSFVETLKALNIDEEGDFPVVIRTLEWVLSEKEAKK